MIQIIMIILVFMIIMIIGMMMIMMIMITRLVWSQECADMAQRAADQCTGRGLHHSNMQVIFIFDLSYMQDLFQLRQVDVQVISFLRNFDLSYVCKIFLNFVRLMCR